MNDSTRGAHAAEIDSRLAEGRMRVLVTGSRDWPMQPIIQAALLKEWVDAGRPPLTLVHGGARGADLMAEESLNLNAGPHPGFFKVERYPANWDLHGRAAGHIRNAEMVALGADLVLAFIYNNSRGATGCLELAERAGIRAVVYRINDGLTR